MVPQDDTSETLGICREELSVRPLHKEEKFINQTRILSNHKEEDRNETFIAHIVCCS